MLAELDERGITSFVDKAGKEWDLERYAEMVARTVSQEAQRHAVQNRMMERGYDLVQVTEHAGACEKCRPWEGRVLSLTGKTEGYPTVDAAFGAGLFHPDCCHSVMPHLGGKRVGTEEREAATGAGMKGFGAESDDSVSADREHALTSYRRKVDAQTARDGGRSVGRVRAHEARLRALGVEADLVGIPEETVESLVDEWERLGRLYPDAVGAWRRVDPDRDGTLLGSDKWLGYHDGVVVWSPMRLGLSPQFMQRSLAQDVVSGMHPGGCQSIEAVACHEFGHAAEQIVRQRVGEDNWKSLNKRLVECDISGYADVDAGECFAEASVALHHGRGVGTGTERAVELVRQALESSGV